MKTLTKIAAIAGATAAALPALAALLTMEGRGVAANRDGQRTQFAFHVRKQDNQPPTGRFEASWARGDARLSLTCTNVRYAAAVRNYGRFSGPGVLKVTTAQGVREVEGTVFVSMWDESPAGSTPDKIRVRFIRDPFGPPAQDHYFEGAVVEGGLSVRSS